MNNNGKTRGVGSPRRTTAIASAVAFLVAVCGAGTSVAAPSMLDVQERLDALEIRFAMHLDGWRAHLGDVPGAERPGFDDSDWEVVDRGYVWDVPNSICWFRRWIEIPKTLGGLPVDGAQIAVRLEVDNGGGVYVNGELRQETFDWADGYAVLTESARPGDRFLVAVRGVNRPGWGSLKAADLESSAAIEVIPAAREFLARMRFATSVVLAGDSRKDWVRGLAAGLDALAVASLERGDKQAFLASLDKAEEVFREKAVGVLRQTTDDRLAALEPRVAALRQAVELGRKQGLDLAYPQVTLTVAENFSRFARDDLGSEDVRIVTRGMWNVDWLNNAVSRTLADVRDLARQRPVPRYTTGPVAIRDGAFWQDGHPLFFVGMGHFGQVRRDIPIFPDYGFNIAQITISVGSVLPSATEIGEDSIAALLATLDRAAKSNVAVDVLIEPHGWPGWVNTKYPELATGADNFIKYKIDHPKSREIFERYLNVLIPRIANHPALFSYCLFNEPAYNEASEFSHERFRDWLREEHGTVATLNNRHGAGYASFEEVPLPESIAPSAARGEKPALAAQRAESLDFLLYDWHRFNRDRFAEVHQWIADAIRRLDPDTPVHSKVMSRLFDTYLEFDSGLDHEAWATATDISGNDNWSYYRSWADHDNAMTGEYAANWWRQAMYYEFQRSVAPGHPVFNSENHPIEDDTPIWVPGRHVRTVYWQGAIHGQGATTTWVWERGDGKTLGDCIITRSNCAHALGIVGLDLLRLGEEVVALQQVPPEIALLVVPASIPFSEDYLTAMKQTFEGLHFLGAPVGFVTDRQALTGGLGKYKAVFVPRAMRMSDKIVASVGQYVLKGGTLVVVGDSFAADDYGKPRPLPAFLPDCAARGESGTANHGNGTVVYRPGPLSLEACQRLGEMLLADLEVSRPLRVTDEKGQIITGIEYRSTPYKEGFLLNIVNYRRHELPVRIIAPGRITRVTNLFDGTPGSDFFELDPLDPLLLFVEAATGAATKT